MVGDIAQDLTLFWGWFFRPCFLPIKTRLDHFKWNNSDNKRLPFKALQTGRVPDVIAFSAGHISAPLQTREQELYPIHVYGPTMGLSALADKIGIFLKLLNQKLHGDNFCFQKFIRTGNYLLLSGSVTSVTYFYILNIYQLSFKKWNFDAQHPGV